MLPANWIDLTADDGYATADDDAMILPATEEITYVFNHILSPTAARWDIHKKEAYAFIATLRHFAHILWGKAFILETDHRNLEFIEQNTDKP